MIDRKPDREITDSEELFEILNKARVLRLGMCDRGGPYVVPMNYGLGRNSLYLHSSYKGRKADILRADPRVCFEVETDVALMEADIPCCFGMRLKSIVGYGHVVFLDSREEKLAGLRAIMAHYSAAQWADENFNDKVLEKTAVLRLDIESMRGAKHGWND